MYLKISTSSLIQNTEILYEAATANYPFKNSSNTCLRLSVIRCWFEFAVLKLTTWTWISGPAQSSEHHFILRYVRSGTVRTHTIPRIDSFTLIPRLSHTWVPGTSLSDASASLSFSSRSTPLILKACAADCLSCSVEDPASVPDCDLLCCGERGEASEWWFGSRCCPGSLETLAPPARLGLEGACWCPPAPIASSPTCNWCFGQYSTFHSNHLLQTKINKIETKSSYVKVQLKSKFTALNFTIKYWIQSAHDHVTGKPVMGKAGS